MVLNLTDAIITVCQFIILLTFHEWAHAKSAEMLGDPTAKDLDRVSFNPAVHIDIVGTIILPLIGTLFGGFFFGWAKPVPVNPRNLRSPKRDMMIIAGAGPIMNVICAAVILLVYSLVENQLGYPKTPEQYKIMNLLIIQSARISIFLAVFNMLPVFPLDGFSVTYGLLPRRQAEIFGRSRQYGMMIFMIILFLPGFIGIYNPVFRLMGRLSYGIFKLIAEIVRLQ